MKINVYFYDSYYSADGTKIRDFDDSHVMIDEADKEGHPIIAYVKFPSDTTHEVNYSVSMVIYLLLNVILMD